VQRDRHRLDEARVAKVESRRQRHRSVRRDTEQLGHAAVAGGAEDVRAYPAALTLPGLTLVAAPAGHDGLDSDRGAVGQGSGELVARDDREAGSHHGEIAAADPRGGDPDERAVAGGFRNVVDDDPAVAPAHGLHRLPAWAGR
jgi:hypothetical protein